jgi:gliding motility-associated-like protein
MTMLAIVCPVFAQDKTVCVGLRQVYRANGEAGSLFEYDVPIGGQLLQRYADSIVVQWGQARGLYRLGVQEISSRGCPGDWAYLNVRVVGAEIAFSREQYMLCNPNGVEIIFNEADFQPAYQWSDRSIKNNVITKPGTYELQAFDLNGCLISKSVTVMEPPKVNLGKDTMICTPGFRLYARKNGTNPEGTLYTWSTGEQGETPYVDIADHATDRNIMYWVRAELDGCSVADTVVVLACDAVKPEESWRIPNTFTPNGDGDNDVWQIYILKEYPNAVVEVYDRWGRRVFLSQHGYPEPWDGRDTNGKILPLETYYYIIGLNDGIHTKPLQGTITIVR